MKDEIHENELIELCQQMRHYEGESEAFKEMHKSNKIKIIKLHDRIRLNKVFNACKVYLMRNEVKTLD